MAKLDTICGNIPEELQDDLALLYQRGYTPTEIIKEGVRCCSDKEGIMIRRRETAQSRVGMELLNAT